MSRNQPKNRRFRSSPKVCPTLRQIALISFALMVAPVAAEIVFVDLDDLPLDPATEVFRLTDGPLVAEFLHIPCAELPPGIFGPPCIVANCGFFSGASGDNADNLTAGETIGPSLRYLDRANLVDYEVTGDPSSGFEWELQNTNWVNRTGGPVRGFLGYGGNSETGGDPHYGWIELTVEYSPASNNANVTLHGYAYEAQSNESILAGETPTTTCDFTGDGLCDIDDIDALIMEVAAMTNDPTFDLTGDTAVDLDDRDEWLAQAGALNLASQNPYLVGDFTLDGNVDGNDFIVWNAAKFTNTGKWSLGDSNGDGVTDGADFINWNANKFMTADVGPAVPEPRVAVFVTMALFFAGSVPRRVVGSC